MQINKKSTVRIAHLLLVHQRPNQVARLVNRLIHTDSVIFIHVDKKVDINDFKKVIPPTDGIHYIRRRTPVKWGAFSMVRAVLSSFEEIFTFSSHIDFINLRSGSDYLLKPINEYHTFLNEHQGKSFMGIYPSNSSWLIEARKRVSTYQMIDYNFRGKYFLQKILGKIKKKQKNTNGDGIIWWLTMVHNV